MCKCIAIKTNVTLSPARKELGCKERPAVTNLIDNNAEKLSYNEHSFTDTF